MPGSKIMSGGKMSFEDLYSKLQERLKNRGILNDLKAELRGRLVQELYEIAPQSLKDKKSFDDHADTKLPLQVSNWFLCDHLERGNYEFTLSTFLRESQMERPPKYSMTLNDVLYILGIPANSKLNKNLIDLYNGEESSGSLLCHIIQHIIIEQNKTTVKKTSNKSVEYKFVQTDSEVMLDKNSSAEIEINSKLMEELQYLRKKLDGQESKQWLMHSEINEKLVKEVEYLRARLKEQEMYNAETILNLRYDPKSSKGKAEESAVSNILGQTEAGEQDNKTQEEYNQKRKEIYRENETDTRRDSSEKHILEETRDALVKASFKLKEKENNLSSLQEQQLILQNENEVLQKRLTSMTNYGILKAELSVTKKELEQMSVRYEETQDMWLQTKEKYERKISELTQKITTPCIELLETHKELQKINDAFHLEQAVWSEQKSELQRSLKEAKQLHERALMRNEDLVQQLDHLNGVIHRLRLELDNTRSYGMQRNYQPNQFNLHSESRFPSRYLPSFNQTVFPEELSFRRDPRTSSSNLTSSSSDKSLTPKLPKFILEAKSRIDRLQAEAESLEERYAHCLDNKGDFFYNNENKKRLDAALQTRHRMEYGKPGSTETSFERNSAPEASTANFKTSVKFDLRPHVTETDTAVKDLQIQANKLLENEPSTSKASHPNLLKLNSSHLSNTAIRMDQITQNLTDAMTIKSVSANRLFEKSNSEEQSVPIEEKLNSEKLLATSNDSTTPKELKQPLNNLVINLDSVWNKAKTEESTKENIMVDSQERKNRSGEMEIGKEKLLSSRLSPPARMSLEADKSSEEVSDIQISIGNQEPASEQSNSW